MKHVRLASILPARRLHRPSFHLLAGAAALVLAAGCGSEGDPDPGVDAAADARPEAGVDGLADARPDGGDAQDGGPGDETPITARPSRGTHTCRVARDRTSHTPRAWAKRQALVAPTGAGGAAYLARLEGTVDPMFPIQSGPARLVLSTLAADGTFGPSTMLSAAPEASIAGVAAVPTASGFAVLWAEDRTLRLATFDAQGAPAAPTRTIPVADLGEAADPRVAAGSDGSFAVVYDTGSLFMLGESRLIVIDGAGVVRGGGSRPLGGSAVRGFDAAPAVVAAPGGYALTWRGRTGTVPKIEFARTDLTGAQVGPVRTISGPPTGGGVVGQPGGFDSATNGLLAVDGGYLAAYAESYRGEELSFSGAWSVVKLVRLDAEGVGLGPAAPLRAPAVDWDEVEPSLVRFGGAVAVQWARGKHIYVCAGCVPDHRIDLLLIDPATLTPLSDVVSVTNGGQGHAGGLLRRETAVLGASLLTTYNLTFHVHATPGSATFTCDPR